MSKHIEIVAVNNPFDDETPEGELKPEYFKCTVSMKPGQMYNIQIISRHTNPFVTMSFVSKAYKTHYWIQEVTGSVIKICLVASKKDIKNHAGCLTVKVEGLPKDVEESQLI